MRVESVTFLCDEKGCRERFTVSLPPRDDQVGPYLDLIAAGWSVKSPLMERRQHRCPAHTPSGLDA